jgi:hypothetical protein
MPYDNFVHYDSFALMWASSFHRLADFRDILRVLNTCDFSVIGSRRDAHTALNTFISSGVGGEELFDVGVRFPDGLRNNFVCSSDPLLAHWFASMASVLSYRSTNVAKDIDSVNNGQSERYTLVKEQSDQDTFKQFTELKKLLNTLLMSSITRWNRASFELKVSGPWVDPPAPRAQ